MRIFTKLLRTCSRASVGYVIPVRNISKVLINNSYFSTRNMAQKSITSFFTVTPKKPAPVKEEIGQNNIKEETSPVTNEKEKQKSSKRQRLDSSKSEPSKSPEKPPASNSKKAPEKIKEETSPVTNGKEKRSSKRQRLDSSESEPSKSPEKSPASDTEKKKKSKRQRIESSGSEAESPKSEPSSPKLKVEKNEAPPKTYQTPKSKKSKAGKTASPLSETNGKVKKKVSPKRTVAVKKEVVTPSIKTEKDAKKKETSPVGVKEKEDTEKKDASDNEKIPKVLDTEYSPAKSKYHPINDACWAKGEAVPYLALAKTLEAIEATSARLKMIEILSNYLRSVIALTPEDLLPSVYMCLNQLAPAYHSLELGIAETYLMKAVGQCTGRTVAQLKVATAKDGDLGAVAARARATQRTMFTQPPLLARRVFAALREVARMTGHASVNKKIAKIQSLFTACRNCEAKYLVRSLEGKLRIGLAEQSVLQALALAATTTPPNPRGVDVLDASKGVPSDQFKLCIGLAEQSVLQALALAATTTPPNPRGVDVLDAAKGVPADQFKARVDANALIIKTTYCECPNYDALIPVLLEHGVAALPQHCKLTPGVPLKPMLAHPARGVGELFARFEGSDFTCEWKYDGERAQIHVPAAADGTADVGKATLYSRNQENNTTKYPDVIGRLSSLLKEGVSSCVLDCEAVAYDTDKKQILPFQILSTRKRKDANESEIKVQVCVFIFDLLYLDGQAMVGRPLAERRELLHEKFNQVPGWWEFATFRDCSSTEEVQEVLQEAVKGSCEGLMVKALRGPRAYYDIARRSHNWLKLKKDYLDGVGDTVDVVVLGGYFGRGKRAGHYGGFLLFCRDGDQYQSLCKIGTGFSDEQLTQFSDELNKHVIDASRSYYRFDKSHSPDAWFSAAIVWEVRCADLSLSPAHHAAIGLVDKEKGISLRFPRFVRVRDDKSPEQATSAEQIAQLYLNQDQIKNHAPAATLPEDDFY